MELKTLRRRCEARLRELDLPAPFSARAFSHSLAARRGRPIRLQPLESPAGLTGAWVATTTADYIFYEEATSPLHQRHIILHELSHLLCGHDAVPVLETEFSQLLLPDLQADMVERVLRRAAYSNEEEQEAELLASLILERVAASPPPDAPALDPDAAALLSRLEASLVPYDEALA
jgi:hypothetical protein